MNATSTIEPTINTAPSSPTEAANQTNIARRKTPALLASLITILGALRAAPRGRRVRRGLLGGLVAVVSTLGLMTQAQAITWTSYGSVAPVKVFATTVDSTGFNSRGVLIQHAAGASYQVRQQAYVIMYLLKWNPSTARWEAVDAMRSSNLLTGYGSGTYSGQMSSGMSARAKGAGYYKVRYDVFWGGPESMPYWALSPSNITGHQVITTSTASDIPCRVTHCTQYNGYVYIW